MLQTDSIAMTPIGTGGIGRNNDELRRRLLMLAPAFVIVAAILYLRLIQ